MGSTYGACVTSILHLEDTALVEYPYNFIPNPNIQIQYPVTFEENESWINRDLYLQSTFFDRNGVTFVRFLLVGDDENDDIAKMVEASWQKNGWYIEKVEMAEKMV